MVRRAWLSSQLLKFYIMQIVMIGTPLNIMENFWRTTTPILKTWLDWKKKISLEGIKNNGIRQAAQKILLVRGQILLDLVSDFVAVWLVWTLKITCPARKSSFAWSTQRDFFEPCMSTHWNCDSKSSSCCFFLHRLEVQFNLYSTFYIH